jgi:hypothetical protein
MIGSSASSALTLQGIGAGDEEMSLCPTTGSVNASVAIRKQGSGRQRKLLWKRMVRRRPMRSYRNCPNSELRQVIHFAGVRRFGEAEDGDFTIREVSKP